MILKVIFANSLDPDQTAHTVCLHAKIGLKSLQEFSADDIPKQTTFSDAGFLGILRVKQVPENMLDRSEHLLSVCKFLAEKKKKKKILAECTLSRLTMKALTKLHSGTDAQLQVRYFFNWKVSVFSSYFSMKTYLVGTHYKRLAGVLLTSTQFFFLFLYRNKK